MKEKLKKKCRTFNEMKPNQTKTKINATCDEIMHCKSVMRVKESQSLILFSLIYQNYNYEKIKSFYSGDSVKW